MPKHTFTRQPAIELDDLGKRYAIYPDGSVRTLASANVPASDFDALMISILSLPVAMRTLKDIDRLEWSDAARWWIIDKLLSRKRITLYSSREEALAAIKKEEER